MSFLRLEGASGLGYVDFLKMLDALTYGVFVSPDSDSSGFCLLNAVSTPNETVGASLGATRM